MIFIPNLLQADVCTHAHLLTSTKMYGFRWSGQGHLCATWRRRDSGYQDSGYQVLTVPPGFLLTVSNKIKYMRYAAALLPSSWCLDAESSADEVSVLQP